MPRRLISGAHEWIIEVPTVPGHGLANSQPRERAWAAQRGKKTLLSFDSSLSDLLGTKCSVRGRF